MPVSLQLLAGRDVWVSVSSPVLFTVRVSTQGSLKCLFVNDQVKQGHAYAKERLTEALGPNLWLPRFSITLPQLAACTQHRWASRAGLCASSCCHGAFLSTVFFFFFSFFFTLPCITLPFGNHQLVLCIYGSVSIYFIHVFCFVRFLI